jgi:hypothetical protein
MSAGKRPSTSSLRRFITSRPYVTVAELRRRFGLDEPDAMALLRRNGTSAWVGLPEREASKLQELWDRNELGVEFSVEVRAPVVVGVYPMRIARYVMEGTGNGTLPGIGGGPAPANGNSPPMSASGSTGGRWRSDRPGQSGELRHPPRPMSGAPGYGARPTRLSATEDGGRT